MIDRILLHLILSKNFFVALYSTSSESEVKSPVLITISALYVLILSIRRELLLESLEHILSKKQVRFIHIFTAGTGEFDDIGIEIERKLKDLLVRSQIEKLSILPAGKTPRNPTELLSSAAMRSFLEKLRERYQDRFIVIDSAPSHITAEAKVLAEYVDGIVLVVMAQKSPRKEIQRAIHNLGRDKILGIVFNGYSHARRNYHKYYEKYYKGS